MAQVVDLPLEDSFADVICKAQVGLKLSIEDLSLKSGLSTDQIVAIKEGRFDEKNLSRLSQALGLGGAALYDLATHSYHPGESLIKGVDFTNTPFRDFSVNAYVVWDPSTQNAAIFDTGTEAQGLISILFENRLLPQALFLTHAHSDHQMAALHLRKQFPHIAIYVHKEEPIPNATTIEEGFTYSLGKLFIRALHTYGHSKGGTTYVIEGLERPVAIVGDSLFAGSMGRAAPEYASALENNLNKILTLPDNTLLCPGHGPVTSVLLEKNHNPFFAPYF